MIDPGGRGDRPAANAVVPVLVEVVFVRRDGESLAYRTESRYVPAGSTPDETAAALAAGGTGAARVVHSTSWRWSPSELVVTYAVVPDPRPGTAGQQLVEPSVVCSGDPVRPAPADLHEHHVAAHAVRHLAYLAEHDPAIAAVAADPPERPLWRAMAAAAAAMPTATHRLAHETAHEVAHETADGGGPVVALDPDRARR